MTSSERLLEEKFVESLLGLKYEHRPDIRDRAALEKNFREKFEALNRVRLTDAEFQPGVVLQNALLAAMIGTY